MSETELLTMEQVKGFLQQGSQVQRKIAVSWLREQDTEEAVDLLLQTFTDVYWLVRRVACDAVTDLGEKYQAQVVAALDDPNRDLNYWSIQVLTRWAGDNHKTIVKALEHPSDEVKSYAIRALRNFSSKEVILSLITMLAHTNWHLRRLAAESLEYIGQPTVNHLKEAFKKHLSDKNGEDISYWTCKILSKLLEKENLTFLRKLLSSPFENLRYHAVGALGDVSGTRPIPALIKTFNDKSWVVRAKASEVLQARGKEAVPFLKKAFMKGNSDIKYWSIKLIAKIMKTKTIPVLEDLIKATPGEVDFYAVTALGEINDEAAIDPLIECFKSSSWLIRQTAAEQLMKMGNRPIDKLVTALDDDHVDVQFFAIQVLSHIGGRGIPVLKKRLIEGAPKTRLAIINAFSKHGCHGVVNSIITALGDSSWKVRRQAAFALEEVGPGITEELIEVFDEWHEDKNYWAVQVMKALFPTILAKMETLLSCKDEYRVWQVTCGYIMLARELEGEDRNRLFESFTKSAPVEVASLLIDFFRHFKKEYCRFIVELLEKISTPLDRVNRLKVYLGSDNYNIRYFTVQLLLRTNDPLAVDLIVQAMESSAHGEKVALVIEAMKDQLAKYPHASALLGKAEVVADVPLEDKVEKLLKTENIQTVESMLALVDIEKSDTRMTLAESISRTSTAEILIPYLKYLKKIDWDYQEDILNELNKRKSDTFLSALAQCLPLVQEDLLKFIHNLLEMFTVTEQRLQFLRPLLQHVELDFRYSIIDYFYGLDQEDAREILLDEVVREKDESGTVHTFDYLSRKLFHKNYVTRNKAMEFLESLGPLAVEFLVDIMAQKKFTPIEIMSFENLIHKLGEEARGVLEKLIESDDAKIARQANRMLSSL